MDKVLAAAFQKINSALSPENLTCDGELSGVELMTKQTNLLVQWHGLEILARTVHPKYQDVDTKGVSQAEINDKIKEALTAYLNRHPSKGKEVAAAREQHSRATALDHLFDNHRPKTEEDDIDLSAETEETPKQETPKQETPKQETPKKPEPTKPKPDDFHEAQIRKCVVKAMDDRTVKSYLKTALVVHQRPNNVTMEEWDRLKRLARTLQNKYGHQSWKRIVDESKNAHNLTLPPNMNLFPR